MAQMQLTLQPRLQAIADLVPQGSRIADVGTDHGYLPIYLLQRNRISCAIATDIRPGPLEHGKRTAREWGREHQISFRLCDGLAEVSPQEVDTVVIAGMGGETIAAILDAVPWCHEKELLLQPMSRAEFLRPWLAVHHYRIQEEQLVLDKGHIYPILRATGGQMDPPSPGERYYGFSKVECPLFRDYLQDWCRRLQLASDGLRNTREPGARLYALEEALRALKEKEGTL